MKQVKRKAGHPVVAIRCCHPQNVVDRLSGSREIIAGVVFGGHPIRVVASRPISHAVSVAIVRVSFANKITV